MRTRWQGHELLMLIILLMLNYGILPLQMPLGQVSATKNEEAFQQGIIERPICDQKLKTKYCNAWYGGDLHTGKSKPKCIRYIFAFSLYFARNP